MWSGPRNLSTAMMYSFAARGDCAVWDEPFYAAYLQATGLAHPMHAEIMAASEQDAARVAHDLAHSDADGQPVFFQKHMCQHMISGMPRDWMAGVTHAFLIRHPSRVLASFSAKYAAVGLDDIGFVQQAELFDQVAQSTGAAPVVIDSADIRAAPDAMLQALCAALGIAFTDRMLTWQPGPKPFDGVWAPVWYGAVHRSSGFAGREGPLPELEAGYARIRDAALPHYERLAQYRLTTPLLTSTDKD
ncbi:HAD family hydrolase [Roseinatronobacter sp. HJB301]|uniref:HAD family hydrolase n=2 Tax=Roseinatronobacter alkalisoli TaxID=3028235 RepID=A0ABT5T3G8_9RHOB|nr:HAD family hydrolase [Roseinatronobacter sp. HJB301]MDD7969668.1 HAD family hydrolase [Roseinatronobacter sp. HJB301]